MYDFSQRDLIIRLVVSLGLGLLLGLEREYRLKPAGLRTHALVAEGSALFMMASLLIGQTLLADGITAYDPSRIASTVVQGVGFLIAGVIIAKGAQVHGLTSAADLWVTSAIGLLAGAGFIWLAVAGTIATLVVMLPLHWIETKMEIRKRFED